jgi:hypothetical protein
MIKQMISKIFKQNDKAIESTSSEVIIKTQKVFLFESDQSKLESIIASPFPEGKHPGYVYFVQEYMNGSFKIGKTKHIEKRMNLFNVKLPFENKLVFLIKTGNHHQTEIAFHKYFSEKRLEGEWFALNSEDVAWIKNEKYTDEINNSIYIKQESTNEHLTKKQIDYAKSMIKRLENEYILLIDYSALTIKDLNRLSVYFRYKNSGALNNLVDAGVIKPK